MTVRAGVTRLSLPLREGEGAPVHEFGPPRAGVPLPLRLETPPASEWATHEDHDTGRVTVEVRDHEGAAHIESAGLFHSAEGVERYSVLPDDPCSAQGEVTWTHEMRREDWTVRTITDTRLTADAADFIIEARLRAWADGELVRDRAWSERIPRHLV